MKRLKKYLDFLKESLETSSIWKIDENKKQSVQNSYN